MARALSQDTQASSRDEDDLDDLATHDWSECCGEVYTNHEVVLLILLGEEEEDRNQALQVHN